MKLRRSLRFDSIFLSIVLGVIGGLYIWAPILKELKIKNDKREQKLSTMNHGKIKIAIGFIAVYFSIVGIKIKLLPYLKNKKLKEAEDFANIIYRSESK